MKQKIPKYARAAQMAEVAESLFGLNPKRLSVTLAEMILDDGKTPPAFRVAEYLQTADPRAIARHLGRRGIPVYGVNAYGYETWGETLCADQREARKSCPFICSQGGKIVALRRGLDEIAAQAMNRQREAHVGKEIRIREQYVIAKRTDTLEIAAMDTLRFKPSSQAVKLLGGSAKVKGTLIFSNRPDPKRLSA